MIVASDLLHVLCGTRKIEDLLFDVEHFVVNAVDDPLHLESVLLVFSLGGGLRGE